MDINALIANLRDASALVKLAFQPAGAVGAPPPGAPPPQPDPAMVAASGGMPPAGSMPGAPAPAAPPPPAGAPPAAPAAPGAAQPLPQLPPEFEKLILDLSDGMRNVAETTVQLKQRQESLEQQRAKEMEERMKERANEMAEKATMAARMDMLEKALTAPQPFAASPAPAPVV